MPDERAPASSHTSFSFAPAPVPKARSRDVSRRTRRYLINMGIRMACLLLILVVPGGWKLLMLAGAVVIPLLAVLFANDQDLAGESLPTEPPVGSEEDLGDAGTRSVSSPYLALPRVPTLTLMEDGTYVENEPEGAPSAPPELEGYSGKSFHSSREKEL